MSTMRSETGHPVGDLATQWHWHTTFRDTSKNMYRTTYMDMIHGREVAVKSDMPSGYGGHVPQVAHDILFKNTEFQGTLEERQLDPKRDSFPCFTQQKDGAPAYAKNTAHENIPTFGTLPDVRVQPPWAITPPIHEVPNYKTVPALHNVSK